MTGNYFGRIFSRRRQRSVVFLNHSYYHFYYLAQALRKRGWDALSVSVEDPAGPHSNYYHGEDLNLFHPNREEYEKKIFVFYEQAKRRFKLLHFATDTWLSFYPWRWNTDEPADILEWKESGNKIAYTSSGCNSATAQTSVNAWSRLDSPVAVCDKCPWQLQPEICSNERNLRWGATVEKHCDVIFAETLPALDYMALRDKVIREPVTTALDPDFWNPRQVIPAQFRVDRAPGELLVFHGFGGYELRGAGTRNIKGSPAIFAAIERLKSEGIPVRLMFVTEVKSEDVRYYQMQADVIVDQLNIGRYGAIAREGMMLGKPVICYINPKEIGAAKELKCLKEVPLVSATEATVYEALKDLLQHPGKRRAIGAKSRRYALKWHGADACARRYEKIYDRLMEDNTSDSEC